MDVGALGDDGVVVEALLLLDQVVGEAAVLVAPARLVALRRELHTADEEPLDEGEGDSNDGGYRNENLRQEIGEDFRSHGGSRRRNGGEDRRIYSRQRRIRRKRRGF